MFCHRLAGSFQKYIRKSQFMTRTIPSGAAHWRQLSAGPPEAGPEDPLPAAAAPTGPALARAMPAGAALTRAVPCPAVLAGAVLAVLPFLLRAVRELSAERAQRIRAQERAEVAALVHDSVLQTLTLIQRKSSDSAEVARLARYQERELREQLYGGPSRLAGESGRKTFAQAVDTVAAEVEDR